MYEDNHKIEINKLAVAEFRKFCRNNNLNFHFPDENLNNKLDHELLGKEYSLASEAIILFNRTEPRIYTTDSVIEFHFVSSLPGDINYIIHTAKSLIIRRDKLLAELNVLEKINIVPFIKNKIMTAEKKKKEKKELELYNSIKSLRGRLESVHKSHKING